MDIQFVSRYGINSNGTTQLRCIQPAEVLRAAGYQVSVDRIYDTRPIANRAIVLHRVLNDNYTRSFINAARARRIPLIYDTDDLIFGEAGSAYLAQHPNAKSYLNSQKSIEAAMRASDYVSVSTQFLAEQAAHIHTKTIVLQNTLNDKFLQLSSKVVEQRKKRKNEQVTLAYLSGSKSHDRDFAVINDALLTVLKKFPHTRLLLVGPLEVSADFEAFGRRIVREDWWPYEKYPNVFGDVDINLIPLEIEKAFCQAKSELKFIEAGACEVVSVATPTAPYKSAIRHLKNGILVETDTWEASLVRLVENKTMRETLGKEARKTVLSHYTPRQSLLSWTELIETVSSHETSAPLTYIDRISNSVSLNVQYWTFKTMQGLSGVASTGARAFNIKR